MSEQPEPSIVYTGVEFTPDRRAIHRFEIRSAAGLPLGAIPVAYPSPAWSKAAAEWATQAETAHREIAALLRRFADRMDQDGAALQGRPASGGDSSGP